MLQDALGPTRSSEALPVCTTEEHSPLGIRDSHLLQMKPHPLGSDSPMSSDYPAIQESIPKQDVILQDVSTGRRGNILGQRDVLAEPSLIIHPAEQGPAAVSGTTRRHGTGWHRPLQCLSVTLSPFSLQRRLFT